MDNIRLDSPPRLVTNDFAMWKLRMKSFLCWLDYDLWRSVTDGPYVPMTDIAGVAIPKEPSDYTDEDKKRINVDLKACAALTLALSDDILTVWHCKSAKELWDTLCQRYDETPEVVQMRKNLLVRQFELFGYVSGESMTQQFERFMSLESELRFYGKVYENECLVNKFVRSLPSCWRTYTMVMRNNMDFKKMTPIQLYGHLRTYEVEQKHDKKLSQVAISSPTIKDMDQFHPDDLEEMILTSEMVMLNVRTKRFTERTGRSIEMVMLNSQRNMFAFDKSKAKCYKCENMGHFARECRLPMQATALNQGSFTGAAYDRSFFGGYGNY